MTGPVALGSTCRPQHRGPAAAAGAAPPRRRRTCRTRSTSERMTRANGGDARDADRDRHIDGAEAERGDQGQRQQQRRDGQQHVDDAHDDVVEHAADEARRAGRAARPTTRPTPTAMSAAWSESAAPWTTRVYRSRPSWSVPNQCAAAGRLQLLGRDARERVAGGEQLRRERGQHDEARRRPTESEEAGPAQQETRGPPRRRAATALATDPAWWPAPARCRVEQPGTGVGARPELGSSDGSVARVPRRTIRGSSSG